MHFTIKDWPPSSIGHQALLKAVVSYENRAESRNDVSARPTVRVQARAPVYNRADSSAEASSMVG